MAPPSLSFHHDAEREERALPLRRHDGTLNRPARLACRRVDARQPLVLTLARRTMASSTRRATDAAAAGG